jgi:ribose 5-phosphate isomerase A
MQPPTAITRLAARYTLQRLAKLPEVKGCEAKLRMDGDKIYVTDNSNYIVDLYFQVGRVDIQQALTSVDQRLL